jgi:polar amino acid transport system substrate-binding protein
MKFPMVVNLKRVAMAVAITVILSVSMVRGEGKQVSLVTLEWLTYAGKRLQNYGLSSRIITEAFKRSGYAVTITFRPWNRALHEVKFGKYDALYCAYHTEERATTYGISDSYGESVLGFFKRQDTAVHFQSLPDLKPYKIGVTLGYANTPEFDRADYLTKDFALTEEQSMKKLIAGRMDLVLMDKRVGFFILDSLPGRHSPIVFIEPPLQRKPLYMLFSKEIKGWKTRVEAFNAGLHSIREDGTYSDLLTDNGS